MSKFPKQFEILSNKIKIVRNRDEYLDELNAHGTYHHDRREIRIHSKLPYELAMQTLYHEIMHCVLKYMQCELWENEDFVELLAQMWYQVSKTTK